MPLHTLWKTASISLVGIRKKLRRVSTVGSQSLRLPFDRITATDGTPMEMHPRPVDLPVSKPVGESYLGCDSQVEAAVSELLKQLGSRSK